VFVGVARPGPPGWPSRASCTIVTREAKTRTRRARATRPRGWKGAKRTAARAGRGRLDQRTTPTVAGVWDEWHEETGKRGAQSVGARRLVGRSLQRRSWMGSWGRLRTRRRSRVGRAKQSPSTHCSSARWPRPFTCATQPASQKFGSRGCGKAWRGSRRVSQAIGPSERTRRRTICPPPHAYHSRATNDAALARGLAEWQSQLESHWAKVAFSAVRVASDHGRHVFEAEVALDGLDPDTVHVELYADGIRGGPPVRTSQIGKGLARIPSRGVTS
jgi:hypothetical protein